jgi:hypothetical protein
MSIERVTIEVTGGPGGNGVTSLYFLDAAAAQPAVCDFAEVWSNALPNDCQLLIKNQGDIIDEENGALTGTWSGGATTGFTGLADVAWTAGVGMRIRWQTAGLVRGRRVSGTSFIVPMGATSFGSNGIPIPLWLDGLGDAATALIADTPGNMVVWSRQKGDDLGSRHVVTSPLVPVEAAFLRTRRS